MAAQKEPILAHLNGLVTWYRQAQASGKWVMEPAEAFFLSTQQTLAAQAVKSAFQAAESEAPLVPESGAAATTAGAEQGQRIATLLDSTQAQIETLSAKQQELDAPGANPDQKALVKAQLDLARAQLTALRQVSSIVNGGTEEGAVGSLGGQVQALQRTLPELFGNGSDNGPAAAPAAKTAAAATVQGGTGLIGRAELLYALMRGRSALEQLISRTSALRDEAGRLRDPVRAQLSAIVQQSQQTAGAAMSTSDPAQLRTLRERVERWTGQYQSLSRVIVPYSAEMTLLAQSGENLAEWKTSLDRQYATVLSGLGLKILVLGGMLVVLLVGSEIARRAAFRYVHDARRRRQILLIRRFIVGGMVTVLLVMGVVSDLSSLATMMGFITAGIAVALQSVILSVAAYFFLIGRYGVKVGDRVTLSGVTGEVIDIGLVRVYLMELAGTGADLYPTGRVVVFANSALFSASTPLYKQIPGTDFTWHELQADLTAEADPPQVRDQLLAAVMSVYNEYKGGLEEQHSSVQRLIDIRLEMPAPSASLRLAETGVEAVIRYPVDIQRSTEIDAKVTERVLEAMRAQPQMKGWLNGPPKVRVAVKV